jgi:hypothetical protein
MAFVLTSNRDEYQESSLGVKGGRSVRLKSSALSLSTFSRNCGSLDVSQLHRTPEIVTEITSISEEWCLLGCYAGSYKSHTA